MGHVHVSLILPGNHCAQQCWHKCIIQRAWDYLGQWTAEAEYLEVIRSGHWLWVYMIM